VLEMLGFMANQGMDVIAPTNETDIPTLSIDHAAKVLAWIGAKARRERVIFTPFAWLSRAHSIASQRPEKRAFRCTPARLRAH